MAKSRLGHIGADGKYHRGESKSLGWDINTTWKAWDHDQQRKQFAAEIIQPHRNGKPSAQFIRVNPEVAKEYWSQEVIDKALREGLAE